MHAFPVYGADDVRALLDYESCITSVRAGIAQLTAVGAAQPLRGIIEIAPGRLFGLMPGSLSAASGRSRRNAKSQNSNPGATVQPVGAKAPAGTAAYQ